MADQKRIVLRALHATPANVIMYPLANADAATNLVYLYQREPTANNVRLRSTSTADATFRAALLNTATSAPVYLYTLEATPANVRLRNPATAPVGGAETGESAAPLIAVAAITAAGQKASETAAPLVAVSTITAAGQEGEDDAAPVSAVATITAAGFKAAESAAPLGAVAAITSAGFEGEGSAAPISAVATITATGAKSSETLSTGGVGGVGGVSPEDVERIRRFLKREKEPITKLYKKLVRVKRYVPEASKAEVVKLGSMYATEAKPLTLDWLNFAAILKAGDQNRMKMLINNAILAAEIARAEEDEDDEDTLLLLYG